MIKRIFSVLSVFVLMTVTVGSYPIANADAASFMLDISAAQTAVYGDTFNAEITLNDIEAGTAVIGVDIYEISYDETVLSVDAGAVSASLDNWEVGASVLTEKYGHGYAKIMATVASVDVKDGMVTQNGALKIVIPFKVIGVPASGVAEIKLGNEVTGVDSSYNSLCGRVGADSATVDIEKSDNSVVPVMPVIESKDSSSVTLKAVDGYEYSVGGSWQKSNVFTGLDADTEYSFSQRIAETATHKASDVSQALLAYTCLDMSAYTYGVLGAQIRENGSNYDLRFISAVDRAFVADELTDVTEFGLLMAREDQRGDDELTVELVETADYTVKKVPITYFSTAYATDTTYTFTVTVLSISDLSREYVVRPFFIHRGNVYYAEELGRCISDGLK